MLRVTLFGFLPLFLSFSTLASGEDFAFARTRPLMALSAELRDKYGLLVTYEDAPADLIGEVNSEIHPNGRTFFFPRWNPITFHVRSGLPVRAEATGALIGTPDRGESLAAVQEVVAQYNQSGNPGKFTAVPDDEYIHIAETKRSVAGKLQQFEPVTTTVLRWQSKSETCQQMLNDLFADLQKIRGVTVVEGAVPIGALLTHRCKVEENSLTTRQILAAVLDGLGKNNVTGRKTASYVWDFVYDPNWNKYFLSFYWVMDTDVSRPEAAQPNVVVATPGQRQRLSRTGGSGPAQPKN